MKRGLVFYLAACVLSVLLGGLAGYEGAQPSVAAGLIRIQAPPQVARVVGPIFGDNLSPVALWLDRQPSEAVADILISSGGGEIVATRTLLTAIERAKDRGVIVRCFAYGKEVASAAFWIWATCSERYATATVELLFHRARVAVMFGMFRAPEAQAMTASLQSDDSDYLDALEAAAGWGTRESLQLAMDKEVHWAPATLDKAFPGMITAWRAGFPGINSLTAKGGSNVDAQ